MDGVGFIVGIDQLMSEARALTNFAGNAVATVLVGKWTGTLDTEQAKDVLAGKLPYDEITQGQDDRDHEDEVHQSELAKV